MYIHKCTCNIGCRLQSEYSHIKLTRVSESFYVNQIHTTAHRVKREISTCKHIVMDSFVRGSLKTHWFYLRTCNVAGW